MLQEGSLRGDFRFRGFTNNSMQSPRQPITAPVTDADDKKRSEEHFVKVFGKSSMYDPALRQRWKTSQDRQTGPGVRPSENMGSTDGNWIAGPGKGRQTGGGGLQYGSEAVDNSPRQRGKKNMFESPTRESAMYQQLRREAEDDILKFKQEKMMHDFQREEEQKKEQEIQDRYPWDRLNQGHGAPKGDMDNRRRKFLETDSPGRPGMQPRESPKPHRGHDLFVTTLGGPGGTVVREDGGGPSLQSMPDPRMVGAYRSPLPNGHQREAELAVREKEIDQQKQRIDDLKLQLEMLKSPQQEMRDPRAGNQGRHHAENSRYEPSFGTNESTPSRGHRNHFDADHLRPTDKRSLDLEATRGGAGAPLRDDRGKPITRFPNTMGRDDFGGNKIQEQIPGKRYTLPNDPIYDPFGRPGGGAPMIDRYGQRNTHTFGNFENKVDSAEQAKKARAKEVMMHDLLAGMEEQQRNKDRDTQYLKAPPGELAEVIRSKEVGRPKVDPITGTLANQHLPNSDVSKVKMNYQPKDETEKRHYQEALREQMEENERNRHLGKLRDKQETRKHFEEFDQTWGHYGGGAPKDRTMRKKVNLDKALFHYDHEPRSQETVRLSEPRYNGLQPAPKQNPSYQKRYFEEDLRNRSPDVSPRYIRNTTHSNSQNQYEYPQDKSPRPVPQTSAPYATGSAHAF